MKTMKVVILGAGRRAIRLARQLSAEKKDVVIVDNNADKINDAMSRVDCLGIVGSGTDIEDLEQDDIQNANAFIALTGSDEVNLIASSIAVSDLKIPNTICALKNIVYSKKQGIMGITHVLNPYKDTAGVISRNIERGVFSDIINFENSALILYNVYVDSASTYAGHAVKDLRTLIPAQFIIAARLHRNRASVPSGDTIIQPGDTLSLVAREESITAILESMGKRRRKPRKTLVVGATRVADFLFQEMDRSKHKNFTLVEPDSTLCRKFSAKYPDILTINAKLTQEGVFKQEGFEQYDLIITLTDSDEQNLIIGSYAKFKGVKAAIAIVNKNPDYIEMSEHLGIDTVVSSQDATVDSILQYMHGQSISTLHSLFDGTIETFECRITSKSKICGKTLMEIDMRGRGIVAGAVKGDETIIPGGRYKIEDGDTLIMVAERNAYAFIQDLVN